MRTFWLWKGSSHCRNEILKKQQDHRLDHDGFGEARRRHLDEDTWLLDLKQTQRCHTSKSLSSNFRNRSFILADFHFRVPRAGGGGEAIASTEAVFFFLEPNELERREEEGGAISSHSVRFEFWSAGSRRSHGLHQ
jgi:hypothetical protein